MQETRVKSLGYEDPLEKEMATHSSTLEGNGSPLQRSYLEKPRDGGAWWAAVYGSHRVGDDWSDLAAAEAAAF